MHNIITKLHGKSYYMHINFGGIQEGNVDVRILVLVFVDEKSNRLVHRVVK